MKYTPRLPEINDNVSPESPIKAFFILLSGLVGIVVVLYLVLGMVVDFMVPRISVSTEKKLAKLFSPMTRGARSTSPEAAYLRSLVEELSSECTDLPYDIKVFIVENELANAVALPGGSIMVFSGLLEKIDSENELAFIMGHEFGHFIHRDHLRGFGRSLILLLASAMLFGPDSNTAQMITGWIDILETGFSRAQETRADEFGIDAVNCRYGHVSGATDFFQKMLKSEDKAIFGRYFSSHPDTAERIRHINAYARERGFQWDRLTPLPPGIIFSASP